eukprot:3057231-Prymnesium_polylepis.1
MLVRAAKVGVVRVLGHDATGVARCGGFLGAMEGEVVREAGAVSGERAALLAAPLHERMVVMTLRPTTAPLSVSRTS